MPRRPVHSEGGGVSRRATRNAAAQPVDNSLLHIDPEAAARHIRALKKQQEAALAGPQQLRPRQQADEQAQQEQQAQQQEQAAEEMERSPGEAQAVAAAVAADAAAAVLVESTKENLPELPAGAAATAAATPLADAIPALGAASKHSGKGTLTAVVQQHGGSRLRGEAGTAPPSAPAAAAHTNGADQQASAAAAAASGGSDAQERQQQEHADAAAAAAAGHEEEPLPEYVPTPEDHARLDRLQVALAQHTEGLVLDSLESVHAKLARWVGWELRPEAASLLLKGAVHPHWMRAGWCAECVHPAPYCSSLVLPLSFCRLAVDQRRAQDRGEVVEMALGAVRDWIAARQQA